MLFKYNKAVRYKNVSLNIKQLHERSNIPVHFLHDTTVDNIIYHIHTFNIKWQVYVMINSSSLVVSTSLPVI